MAKVLLVEDDLELADKLSAWLKTEKYLVDHVADGRQALEMLKTYEFDLVVLDWDLPEMSGIDVCRNMRSNGSKVPILMLTGKGTFEDKEEGLDSGCDDYLTKPFDTRELAARLRALLRRPTEFSGMVLKVGNVTLQPTAHKVERDGQTVELSRTEYALLEFLMRHPNQVFSPDALLNNVWTSESEASIDTVRTYIKTLRKKLSDGGGSSIIRTIFGVGYKVTAE
jgi:DNA-binding response OmpR family regulator